MRAALTLAALLLVGCGKTEQPLPYTGARIVAPAYATVAPTGSMRPTYVGGERIYIAPIAIADVRVGDVVAVYWQGSRLNALHRVVAIRIVGGMIGLVTKGDANMERDAHITTAGELIGIVR